MILEVKQINTFYGTSHILFDVSLTVDRGEIVCLLGRNGAGKTTTMRSIMGLTPPKSGSVQFHSEELRGRPPHHIAQKGMGYVPDNRLIFPDLTVRQNLEIAYKVPKDFDGDPWTIDRIYQLFPILEERSTQKAGSMSGGEMQMLEMGRALLLKPRLILLDEPSLGLSPLMAKEVFDKITDVNKEGTAILMVEQNADQSLKMSDYAYVLEEGRNKCDGPAEQIRTDSEIKKLYLGG